MVAGSVVKGFFSKKFNLYLFIILLLLGMALIAAEYSAEPVGEEGLVLHYFYLPGCPHCKEQEPIVKALEKELADVKFYYHDASTQEGATIFFKLASEQGMDATVIRTPTIILNHGYLIGVHTREEILDAIEQCRIACEAEEQSAIEVRTTTPAFTDFELPFLGRVDLTSFSLPGLAIVLGLIDGFNPCAMWVLVYLIALLMDVDDKRKMWLIVGTFLFASGFLYFLFMTAWLNAFLLLGYISALTVAIGLVALGGGILLVKEYFDSKGNLECKIQTGEGQKKTMQRVKDIVMQPLSIPIVGAIVVLAFVVNSVEFVCSSAIPAVFTQILALNSISALERYAYILLYDVFFMLDDLIIFSLAVFAVSSSFGQKYAKYCRIIGGIILVILGLMLLFAPGLLG